MKKVVWEEGRSSALLENEQEYDKYEINKIHDKNYETAWVEGKADEVIGEWVIIPVEDEDAYAQQFMQFHMALV